MWTLYILFGVEKNTEYNFFTSFLVFKVFKG